jgi:hypothetical protein
MKRLIVCFSLVCMFLFSGALAQTELEIFAGAYNPGTSLVDADLDSGTALGFRIGQSFAAILGTELGYTNIRGLEYRPANFDENVHLITGNFLLQAPIGAFVPFGTAGFGGIIGQDDTDFQVRRTITWNAGGGLKLRNLAGPIGLRFDIRYHKVPDGIELRELPTLEREDFDFLEVTGGLLLTF